MGGWVDGWIGGLKGMGGWVGVGWFKRMSRWMDGWVDSG